MKKIYYDGESKALKRMAELLNLKPETGDGHEDAYYGDLSKEAYEHSQLTSGNPHHVTLADLGLEGIIDKINAIMLAIGMTRSWITHSNDMITDHDGAAIWFHGAGAEEAADRNYLIWH
jgi:hypothetical protein